MKQTQNIPLTRDLVLVGGGHTHALVLRMWGMAPVPGVRLTLVNPGPTAPYSGMLPGHVAGHYDRSALDIDLVQLARFAGARLVLGAATGIDRAAREVSVTGRPPIRYDIASIDIGITSDMPDLPGFAAHGVPAKPLGAFADAWAGFCARDGAASIAVIGAGIAGVELALAAAHRMRSTGREAKVHLLDRGPALDGFGAATRARLLAALAAQGVSLLENVTVARLLDGIVELADGRQIASDFTLGAAGARAHPWLADLGLATEGGALVVEPSLRSVTDPAIYAAGDCAYLAHAPRPKAGVFAVRAAPILLHNLHADLTGGRRRAFHPQRDYLKLISLGRKSALAEKRGLAIAGPMLWRWKDRIDQRFMAKFRTLPEMARAVPPPGAALGVREAMGDAPLCGGCGAKLGRGALASALTTLPAVSRPDVLSRPGDDAAVLKIGGARAVLTTDHLRAFTEDPVLLARVAAVHAMGDVWAMGATPQAALATVILPRMTPEMQAGWLAELMAEAAAVFGAEGAEIVGGHSSMGDEMTLGFTVTGLLEGDAITLEGARPGDALILTKPLGTGVILAAEMQRKARGAWVAAAWEQMSTPSGTAARLLRGAHAMTDVTGFGLAGHLMGICEASGTGATLGLDSIPLLDGASFLAERGVRSTLYPENRATLVGRISGASDPLSDLLFDPQTSGGMLAAVSAAEAAGTLESLRAAGIAAARIGAVTDGPVQITLR